jgi:CO/xanthine dehydrogenase FAD-binding subunit
MRNDAQIVADAHAALRVRCEDLERGLSDERRRNEDLERKVAALAEQIRGGLGASGSFFSP